MHLENSGAQSILQRTATAITDDAIVVGTSEMSMDVKEEEEEGVKREY
mgnify:CR=1 FL=1